MRLLRVLLVLPVMLFGNALAVSAQSEFRATLSGANENPPVAGIGFGLATLDVNVSGGVLGINFELTGVNVAEAHMGHIHCGTATENGPIVVWLAGVPSAPATAGYDLNGSWVKAKVTETSIIQGTPCGNTLVELLTAMANGRTYVNIHTRNNPGGEIRGQIQLVAPFTIP
jgi:hypothetical protein